MNVLGHDNMEHAELYSRDAEQAIMAVEAMDKVIAFFDRGEPSFGQPLDGSHLSY